VSIRENLLIAIRHRLHRCTACWAPATTTVHLGSSEIPYCDAHGALFYQRVDAQDPGAVTITPPIAEVLS